MSDAKKPDDFSGVYQIRCTENGRAYVGSSNNWRNRWSQHKQYLKNGTHCNYKLQRAWNKYGPGAFEFTVLEKTIFLFESEAFWLSKVKPWFNIAKHPGGAPRRGLKDSPETRRKKSEAGKRREPNRKGAVMSDIGRARISAALRGNTYRKGKKDSPETREKKSVAIKAAYARKRAEAFR